MRKSLTIVFMSFFLVSLGCAHTTEPAREAVKKDTAVDSPATTGTPAVDVPESYFNFGEVKEGNDYTHAFVIRNNGTGVLEVKKVVPG